MAQVPTTTPHLARRLLALDILRRGFYVKEIRLLPDFVAMFDDEEWEIP
jgi:hypothetical protein